MQAGMEEDGYVIIPGVIDRAEVAEVKRRIDELRPFGYDCFDPGKKQVDHYKNVFNRSPFWLPYLDKPGVIDVAESVMGADCHIIGMTGWRSPPGVGGWGMHIDQQFFPVEEELLVSGRIKLPVMLATAHFYLNDMTLDLCPTWVVPGSHKSGRGPGAKPGEARYGFVAGDERSWRGQEAVPVLVKAGDVMIFRSEVWHTGSKNQTADQTRYLLQVHYGRRMMAQKFSPYLDFRFNHEVVAQATARQRRLLGGHQPGAYD
ncbi:MAG: phytanoyl-CoA dioxygenase family protein [Planctomycetes bacterium]|nr:phytanoyl-CoA dioxygenase family protein [Planctomycetota bacterium]